MVGTPNNAGVSEERFDVLVPCNFFKVGGPNNVGVTKKMSTNSLFLEQSPFISIEHGDQEANINEKFH